MSRSVSDVRQYMVVYIVSGSMQRDFAADTALLSKLIMQEGKTFMCSSRE